MPQKSGSLIRDGGPTPPAPRRFFFPPFPSLLFYSHVIAKNRASLSLSFLLFLLSFYFPPTIDDHHRAVQESDRVQHLSRLLAPASDYDDPSTTTVSSFSFDLWITDNRIRRTCSSYSPYDQSRPNHPLHTTHQRKPPCFSFFPFFTRMPESFPKFSLLSVFLSFYLLSSSGDSSNNWTNFRPWIHSLSVYRSSKTLNRGLSSRLKLPLRFEPPPSPLLRDESALRPRFQPLFFAGAQD